MRARALVCLLLAAALQDASAAGFYDVVDELRAGRKHCPAAQRRALEPVAALEKVARDLAQGGQLARSLKQSGYRASRSSVIHVTGGALDRTAAAFMARQGFCKQLQDAGFSHVGVHQDARQLWIVLAAPFAPSPGVTGPAAGRRILNLVNHARAHARKCGGKAYAAARPVRWNELLAEASRQHAEDMARHSYMSHSGRDGSTPGQRVERAGYRYRATGENLAGGPQMTPEVAVAGWTRSPGHCANLMNPDFTEMGAAYAVDVKSEMGVYWAQAFGAPR